MPNPDAPFPLTVALSGGRVQHVARLIGDGPAVMTACRKPGVPTGDGTGLPFCAACSKRPNYRPVRQQTTNYPKG